MSNTLSFFYMANTKVLISAALYAAGKTAPWVIIYKGGQVQVAASTRLFLLYLCAPVGPAVNQTHASVLPLRDSENKAAFLMHLSFFSLTLAQNLNNPSEIHFHVFFDCKKQFTNCDFVCTLKGGGILQP